MPDQIQAGTMMLYESANLQSLALEGDSYCTDWRSLGTSASSGLESRVRALGWTLFFLAGEIRAVVPAWGGHNTLRRGVKRLLARTHLLHFNCLEVNEIHRKYFLGVPYLSISANPRHIQPSCQIESMALRLQHESA